MRAGPGAPTSRIRVSDLGFSALRIKLSFLLFHRREKTHDSATNKIGINLISRPFSQCQSLLIYQQLVTEKCAMEFSPTTLTLSSTTSRTSCWRPSWSSSSWRSVSIAGGPGPHQHITGAMSSGQQENL
nr:PI-PLC X-box domain-containing protein DDB_G0293730-like [Ipomoea trifida]